MVCSGSEANDLALRIARENAPGQYHVAVMDGAYHGHTTACIDLSPYKFAGPGGAGVPNYVHVLPCPDVYRSAFHRWTPCDSSPTPAAMPRPPERIPAQPTDDDDDDFTVLIGARADS
jgi:4-aminobutyrate aminotransferase-like enzyme